VGMDKGVQQRGNSRRPEVVHAPQRPQALPAEEMGSGANLLMALSEQEDEQRLRASSGELRSPHLRGDEPPDGEEVGSLMRVFRQFPKSVLGSSPRAGPPFARRWVARDTGSFAPHHRGGDAQEGAGSGQNTKGETPMGEGSGRTEVERRIIHRSIENESFR
jgi:hypothetical protein